MASQNPVFFLVLSLFFFTSSISSKSDANANALLAFKSKADIHNKLWFSSSATSFCKWTGVECSNAKPVRFIVEDMNLGGIFAPNTLTRLDQLRVLSLRNNSLTGPIPDLSGLLNLKVLFLSQNYFAGSIPVSVSSLHRLKTLDLSSNHLSGPVPETLNQLDRLFTLRLESNWLNGSIPALNQSGLRIFNISHNSLTGPVPVTEALLRMEPSSFWWNTGLCGEIVHTECREMQQFFGDASPPPPPTPTVAAAALGQNAQIRHGNHNVDLTHPENKKTHRETALVIGFSSAGFIFLCSLICLAMATRKRGNISTPTPKVLAGQSSINAHIEAVMRIEEENHELEEKIRRVQEGIQIAGMGKSGNLVFCGGEHHGYTLEKLMRASAELLGRGTLATTYRAALDSGAVVCVKRLDAAKMAGTSKEAFEGHMQAVGGLRHPNLVALRAYFQAREERLLIYDYQPNGSLFSLIHCSKSSRAKPLHWTSCLKIAEDVAQGLSYIHQAWRLVHGNLKSSNVLLGPDFEACLTDHCLSTLANPATDDQPDDTTPYKAPETLNSHDGREATTSKSDVYSFGILVLELLSGKHPSELPGVGGGGDEMMRWVKLNRDGDEKGEDGNKVEMLVEVGLACSMTSPEQRPTMWQVLKMIQEIKEAVVMEDL